MTGKTGMRQSDIPDTARWEFYSGGYVKMAQREDTGCVRIIGVTGGVGAGKSTVLSYLEKQYGAYILEADAIGHLVQRPEEPCWEHIVEAFGVEILNGDRSINREILGGIVYADREKLDLLNGIVHPAVKRYIRQEIERIRSGTDTNPFIVIEAALLLEDHYDEICDEIWYIYADVRMRTERLMKSRGYSMEKVRRIMKNQMSEEEFRSRCPVVLDNSGADTLSICGQIDRIMRERSTEQSAFTS
ncbi:MAG: dephospho-CoA kinase [Lachnospiraceae bacterium]|nr:dephospho-CoA kinase [Lachnospiraceae bacterium]